MARYVNTHKGSIIPVKVMFNELHISHECEDELAGHNHPYIHVDDRKKLRFDSDECCTAYLDDPIIQNILLKHSCKGFICFANEEGSLWGYEFIHGTVQKLIGHVSWLDELGVEHTVIKTETGAEMSTGNVVYLSSAGKKQD